MSLNIGDNFSYLGAKPLDNRLKYMLLADMVAMTDSTLYDGIIVYCAETGNTYQWKSANDVDATLGKWREFKSGGSDITVDNAISATSENPVQNKAIKTALDGKDVTVTSPAVEPVGILKTYIFEQNSAEIGRITIPKDKSLEDGDVVFASVSDPITYKGTTYTDGEAFMKLIIENKTDPVYVLAEDFIDKNIIKAIKLNGTTLVPDGNKAVNIEAITEVDVNGVPLVPTNGVVDIPVPITQVTALPNASVDELDNIYQYTGATTATYTNGYFYKCILDDDGVTYKWVTVEVQDGGTGGSSLGKAITAAIDVGGIETGDTFAQGTNYDDMWDALLNPTLYPTFTNPSASLSYSADTYYEVGTSITAKTATVSLNRGTINPAYGTSGYRSGVVTNYAIATNGADTEYSDSSASSGNFSVPALTRATKGNIVLTATVSYASGEQPKDSKGNDYDSPLAAGSKTASKTMQFIQPYYYGKSAIAIVSNFTGLTKSVTAKGQKQFKFTTNNEYMVIAYDSSYGNLSSIIDPNGFETISGWTKSTLTVDGFNYYVYVANSATTDTNAQFTFKY